jgi:hypothetical protein
VQFLSSRGEVYPRHWWLTSVILANQENGGRKTVQANSLRDLSRKYLTLKGLVERLKV